MSRVVVRSLRALSLLYDDAWRNGAYWWCSGKVNLAVIRWISQGADVSQYQLTVEPEEVTRHPASRPLWTRVFRVTPTGTKPRTSVSHLLRTARPLREQEGLRKLPWPHAIALESAVLASPNSPVTRKLTATCPQHGYTRTLPRGWPPSVSDTEFLSSPAKSPLGQTSSISFNDLINFHGIELRSFEILPLIPDTCTNAFFFLFHPVFQPSSQ